MQARTVKLTFKTFRRETFAFLAYCEAVVEATSPIARHVCGPHASPRDLEAASLIGVGARLTMDAGRSKADFLSVAGMMWNGIVTANAKARKRRAAARPQRQRSK
jgi:hypothetical protein